MSVIFSVIFIFTVLIQACIIPSSAELGALGSEVSLGPFHLRTQSHAL